MQATLKFREGFWRLADPKISLASMSSIFLGACAAASAGRINYFWLFLTIIGIFAVEVAKNASGEIFDFDSRDDQAVAEKDRSPFSGGKRVLVDGFLTRRQAIAIALVSYFVGIVVGLLIVLFRESVILWYGIVGIGLAYFYHASPLKLSYRGLGEIAVAIAYGPLICVGTYLVQRSEITLQVVVVALMQGLLIANFLLINEFPDYEADKHAGKRTLVVKFGRHAATRLFTWTFGITLLLLLFLPLIGFSLWLWLGCMALPAAYNATTRLLHDHEHVPNIIPAQANTLLTFLLFAFGAGIGFLIS